MIEFKTKAPGSSNGSGGVWVTVGENGDFSNIKDALLSKALYIVLLEDQELNDYVDLTFDETVYYTVNIYDDGYGRTLTLNALLYSNAISFHGVTVNVNTPLGFGNWPSIYLHEAYLFVNTLAKFGGKTQATLYMYNKSRLYYSGTASTTEYLRILTQESNIYIQNGTTLNRIMILDNSHNFLLQTYASSTINTIDIGWYFYTENSIRNAHFNIAGIVVDFSINGGIEWGQFDCTGGVEYVPKVYGNKISNCLFSTNPTFYQPRTIVEKCVFNDLTIPYSSYIFVTLLYCRGSNVVFNAAKCEMHGGEFTSVTLNSNLNYLQGVRLSDTVYFANGVTENKLIGCFATEIAAPDGNLVV